MSNLTINNINQLKDELVKLFPLHENDFRVWENYGKSRVYCGKHYYELDRQGGVITNHRAWILDLRYAGINAKTV